MTEHSPQNGREGAPRRRPQHPTSDPRTGRASEEDTGKPREGSRPDGTSRVEREFEREGGKGPSD